jgi:hypothetical protein
VIYHEIAPFPSSDAPAEQRDDFSGIALSLIDADLPTGQAANALRPLRLFRICVPSYRTATALLKRRRCFATKTLDDHVKKEKE